MNRRKFIQKSAALGRNHIPNIIRAGAHNETRGVAVVGVGGRGKSHIGAYLADKRTEVRYIVDIDEKIGAYQANAIESRKSAEGGQRHARGV